jgi:proteasome lid subunit RPN8/RPN11
MNSLLPFLDSDAERVGFVMKNGEIIECKNICEDPENGFDVSGEEILRYYPDAEATWHTHPGRTANLSANDYETFVNWPELAHFIVGTDGVKRYVVENGQVLIG